MKSNVAEFSPVWSGWALPEKTADARPNGSSRLKPDSERPETNLPGHSDGNHGTPPFWTWFIENPRRVGV
jgi:hypothetical protein